MTSGPQVDDTKLVQTTSISEEHSTQQPVPDIDEIPAPGIIGIKGAPDLGEGLDIHPTLYPTHFLMRPGPGSTRSIVPLIPLDLLPEYIEVVGLPRYLSPTQIARMSSVGTHDKPADGPCYKMRITQPVHDGPGTKTADPPLIDHSTIAKPVDPSEASVTETTATASHPPVSPSALILEAAAAASAHHLLSSPKPKAPGRYCRHYCHHGTCRWGAYCKYQHVMPGTPEGLAEVGLRGFPAWFRAVVFSVNGDAGGHAGRAAAERKRREREEKLERAREAERVEMQRLERLKRDNVRVAPVAIAVTRGEDGKEKGEAVQQTLVDLN